MNVDDNFWVRWRYVILRHTQNSSKQNYSNNAICLWCFLPLRTSLSPLCFSLNPPCAWCNFHCHQQGISTCKRNLWLFDTLLVQQLLFNHQTFQVLKMEESSPIWYELYGYGLCRKKTSPKIAEDKVQDSCMCGTSNFWWFKPTARQPFDASLGVAGSNESYMQAVGCVSCMNLPVD